MAVVTKGRESSTLTEVPTEPNTTPGDPAVSANPPTAPACHRVILHGISWQTYEKLLTDLESSSGPRLAYDHGTLEIMSPLSRHEQYNRTLALLVEIIAEEWELDLMSLGSTTFRREDLERGFEPDSCFYFRNTEAIRGKERIDLTVDPPPELVIEIDITHTSLNKLPLYMDLGVGEVWRYDGTILSILTLEDRGYRESDKSLALPGLKPTELANFVIDRGSLKYLPWLRKVREWARQIRDTGGS